MIDKLPERQGNESVMIGEVGATRMQKMAKIDRLCRVEDVRDSGDGVQTDGVGCQLAGLRCQLAAKGSVCSPNIASESFRTTDSNTATHSFNIQQHRHFALYPSNPHRLDLWSSAGGP